MKGSSTPFDAVMGKSRGRPHISDIDLLCRTSTIDHAVQELVDELKGEIQNHQYTRAFSLLKAAPALNQGATFLLVRALISERMSESHTQLQAAFEAVRGVSVNSQTNLSYSEFWQSTSLGLRAHWTKRVNMTIKRAENIDQLLPVVGVNQFIDFERNFESKLLLTRLSQFCNQNDRGILDEMGMPAYIGRDNTQQWEEVIKEALRLHFERFLIQKNGLPKSVGYITRKGFKDLAVKSFRKVDEAND